MAGQFYTQVASDRLHHLEKRNKEKKNTATKIRTMVEGEDVTFVGEAGVKVRITVVGQNQRRMTEVANVTITVSVPKPTTSHVATQAAGTLCYGVSADTRS